MFLPFREAIISANNENLSQFFNGFGKFGGNQKER